MAAKLFYAKQKRQSQQARRILLIEDNDVNRMLLSDYLSYHRYYVRSLAGASNFFSTVAEFRPELILLDLKLPDIDGYALLEQIQQQPQLVNIPIIVVSAFAFRADCEKAMKLGARRYFVKPINLSLLIQEIQEEFACLSL
ncbi:MULTISPECIES: response regulator [Nostocales]|uniref:Chemotaxis protein CheY n=3 Tax=Nostocales TaxID=1161 RepID=A0A0C1QPP8_9CYAN|nr:response regulator [Tolypothrix bouteillei]KAF3889052.1 response regulator [Tolypothrix bouteillei VB521301]